MIFLFIFIAFISVSTPVNHGCDQFQTQTNASFPDQCLREVNSHPSDLPPVEGDHSVCHNCHLGHCSFTLSSEIIFLSYDILTIFDSTETTIALSDFLGNPFRPPIS